MSVTVIGGEHWKNHSRPLMGHTWAGPYMPRNYEEKCQLNPDLATQFIFVMFKSDAGDAQLCRC
jgi:hypothetical protein